MFLDESDFDIEETNEPPRRTSNYRDRDRDTASRGNSGGYGTRPNTSQSLTVSLTEFEDDDLGDLSAALGSAGGLGTPSSSRARMLAQQREIQLKKRQNNIQSGMIRSSVDSSVDKSAQFTPAVRQFSAPKTTTRDYTEYETSDFSRPARAPAPAARGGWDVPDEDPEPRYQSPKDPYRDPRDHPRRAPPRDAPRRRGYDDDDEEEDYRSNGRENRRRDVPPPRRGYDEYYEDEPVRRPRPAGQREWRSSGPRKRDDEDDYREPERHRREPPREARRPRRYEDDDGYEDSYRRDEDSYRRAAPRDHRGDEDWEDDRPAASRRGGKHNRRRSEEDEEDDDYGRVGERWGSADRGGRNKRQGNTPTPIPKEMPAERLDLSNMQRFLTTPVPKRAGVVQCYIRRNRSGTHKLFPIYSLYLKDEDVFLFCSKKRPNNKTSNYLISKVEGELNRESDSYMGKLRSNFMGTEFQVFDNGANPSAAEGGRDVRRELGAVMYAPNVLGSRGPRKMQVAIPAVDENNQIVTWRQTHNSPDGEILQRMKDRNFRDLIYLINKPPRWNEQVGAYVLNFSGRVTMASVKNFQLVDPDEQNAVLLQFGRVGKDEFTMDMQWPLSPLQAFAITLSSFDSKIACD